MIDSPSIEQLLFVPNRGSEGGKNAGIAGTAGTPLPYAYGRCNSNGSPETPRERVNNGGVPGPSTPSNPSMPAPSTGLWDAEPDAEAAWDERNPAVALVRSLAPFAAESRCPDCGAAEDLIDGLWWACAACHPKTARRGTPWR